MPQSLQNTGYPQGTNRHVCRGIPCSDTLPEIGRFHWRTLCTGYLRVTIFTKKEEVVNERVGM